MAKHPFFHMWIIIEKDKSMSKRKGALALTLLILLSGVLTLVAGLLLYLQRTDATAYYYENGLASVYGAESGANWALVWLQKGNTGNVTKTFTLGNRKVKVVIQDSTSTGGSGYIKSSAGDAKGNHMRYLKLTYTAEDREEGRQITVEDISSDKF